MKKEHFINLASSQENSSDSLRKIQMQGRASYKYFTYLLCFEIIIQSTYSPVQIIPLDSPIFNFHESCQVFGFASSSRLTFFNDLAFFWQIQRRKNNIDVLLVPTYLNCRLITRHMSRFCIKILLFITLNVRQCTLTCCLSHCVIQTKWRHCLNNSM